MIILAVLISGCGKPQTTVIEKPVPQKEQCAYELAEELAGPLEEDIVYGVGDTMPIISDGKLYGYAKINWVQRVCISDPLNLKATTAGIDYSYTINLNLDFSQSLSGSILVKVVPRLLIDDRDVGAPCSVGWSGFSEEAQLFQKNPSDNIEVGIQPEEVLGDDFSFRLDVCDDHGVVYDELYVAPEMVKYADETGRLVLGSNAEVHSINGATMEFNVGDVFIENCKLSGTTFKNYYAYQYTIKYLTAPQNGRDVSMFDKTDGNSMRSNFTNYIVSNVDNTKSYEGNEEAQWSLYWDYEKFARFMTTDFVRIPPGYNYTIQTNREIPGSTGNPESVRIVFEFPEEISARSLEETKDFDGRFLVFARPITERVLESYYEEAFYAE